MWLLLSVLYPFGLMIDIGHSSEFLFGLSIWVYRTENGSSHFSMVSPV
jgi:hypothetical protein